MKEMRYGCIGAMSFGLVWIGAVVSLVIGGPIDIGVPIMVVSAGLALVSFFGAMIVWMCRDKEFFK